MELDNLNTSRLANLYEEWLAENGLDGAADELLICAAAQLTNRQREWLEDFCAAWERAQDEEDIAQMVAMHQASRY